MNSGEDDLDQVLREHRAAIEKLSREANRLKQLFELQSLKQNPLEVTINPEDILKIDLD